MATVIAFTSYILIVLCLSFIPLSIAKDEEGAYLLKLKSSFQNTTGLDSSWKKGTLPCDEKKEWIGLHCDNGSVTGIRLEDLGLSGTIDVDSLGNLTNLRAISFANNSFSGNIPDLTRLGALKSLYLDGNNFSGEIPEDYFSKLRSLKKIYLAHNKFSGKIPESLAKVHHLMELHLENNEFTGPVPLLPQPSITEINFSHNKLEGEVPEGMLKFNPEVFDDNPGLCSPKLANKCPQKGSTSGDKANETKGSSMKWIIIGSVVALLLVAFLINGKQKEEQFHVLGREKLGDHKVHENLQSSIKRSLKKGLSNSNSYRSSHRGGSGKDRSMGALVIVNEEKGLFGLQDLMRAAAEVLGNGGLGSAYKAAMVNGVSVVVKRLREMNDMSMDAIDAEMKKLGRLKHQNILPLLAYHYRNEEKLLVSEYIPNGSLLYLLHGDRGISHAELNWPTRLKIIKGVARGLDFLFSEFSSYDLPHGNLKSSNILLDSDYEPLLTDYAFYPLISNTCTSQSLFAYNSPEAILYQQITSKSDVYCLGIVILEILTGKYPSQYLNNQKGGTDVVRWANSAISERREMELIDPEIASSVSTNSLGEMEKLLHIGAACTVSSPDRRLDMNEAIMRIEEIQI